MSSKNKYDTDKYNLAKLIAFRRKKKELIKSKELDSFPTKRNLSKNRSPFDVKNKHEEKSNFTPKSNDPKGSSPEVNKSWWVHLLSGLVIDNTAKHKNAMNQAIWLYLFLLLVANRRTGKSFRRISTISRETGFHPRTIHRWLKILRENGYVITESNGRSLRFEVTKWKPIIKPRKTRK